VLREAAEVRMYAVLGGAVQRIQPYGLGFSVYSLGLRVKGLGLRVSDCGL
jgi:hypothetical protein